MVKHTRKDVVPLSEYLLQARKNRGLSQWEVAQLLGYTSAQFISNMERGLCSPPLKSIRKFIEIYKIDPNHIFSILLAEQEAVIEKSVFGSSSRRRKSS